MEIYSPTVIVGQKLFTTKNCFNKGIEVVTVTRIYHPNSGFFWDDNNKEYQYLDTLGTSTACLQRALYLNVNAFHNLEDAIENMQKKYFEKIHNLHKELEGNRKQAIKALTLKK